ncbi:glycoside hydrolase [Ophiostoma piceae UAMH 11346]|uniref:Glycoside hydrolase n=1 Tax=Ophiostoma piceae (strain UAMH 11346) TaxID=1262450 RepID=S3D5X7_OPHP1|nr:glycoside hydrolase [Ophiostoma piceae UAMH 11346]
MFSTKLIAFVAALMAQEAVALNAHRHAHNDFHGKRAVVYVNDVVTVTDWTTVTVYDDGAPASTSAPKKIYKGTHTASTGFSSSANSTSSTATSSSFSSSSSTSSSLYTTSSSTSIYTPTTLATSTKCSWSYNWGQTAASDASSDVEFIPMLWSPDHSSTWTESANAAISSGTTALLSFNECDNSGQCNLDAASAAAAHITYMNPYSGKAKIGAPAITNSGNAGEGISWLTSFISACDGQCAIDFCPLHWYNAPDAEEFLEHVSNVHAACGKPVWITEFAPISGSDSDIASFLETVMTALDSDTYSYVERYSYFMAATGSLLTSSTSLSTYGETFAYY